MKRVASVAVMAGDRLLVGKRSDDQRWNLPGGHVEEGETPEEGAARELREETGIDVQPSQLLCLCPPTRIVSFTGKDMEIHSYLLIVPHECHTKREGTDPGEAHDWSWVNISEGLHPDISGNWHNTNDPTMSSLGLPISRSTLEKAPDKLPDEKSKQVGQHEPYSMDPKHDEHVVTHELKGGLYHHVLRGKDSQDDYVHTVSHNSDPQEKPLSTIEGKQHAGRLIIHAAYSDSAHKGKGYGKLAYQAALAHHGALASDSKTSANANKAWEHLSSTPGVKAKLGGERHEAHVEQPSKLKEHIMEKSEELEKAWPKEYNRVAGQAAPKGTSSEKQKHFMQAVAAGAVSGHAPSKSEAKEYVANSGKGLPDSGSGGSRGKREEHRKNRKKHKKGNLKKDDGHHDDVGQHPVKLNRHYEVEGLAGYSHDGDTIYIDRRLPAIFKGIHVDRYLLVHETVEKALEDKLGFDYELAHQCALRAERNAVEKAGVSWDEYDGFMQHWIRYIEHHSNPHLWPPDLDRTPYGKACHSRTLDEIEAHVEKSDKLDSLISEHKHLVHVLHHGDPKEEADEAARQAKELHHYQEQAKKDDSKDNYSEHVAGEAIKRQNRPKVVSFGEQVARIKAKHAEKQPKTLDQQIADVKAKAKMPMAKSSELFYAKIEKCLDQGLIDEHLLSNLMDVELASRENESIAKTLFEQADRLFNAALTPEEQVVAELSYLAKNGDEDARETLEQFTVEMYDEVLKHTSIADAVTAMVKSNYGPKGMGLYSEKDNIGRKMRRTGEVHADAGKNVAAVKYTPSVHGTMAQQATREAKVDQAKSKANPVKVYTAEEKAAFAAERAKKGEGDDEQDKNLGERLTEKGYKSEDNSRVVGKKNGASVRKVHGYLRYTSGPKRGEYVHRHEAEKRLGRKLKTKEHVDHVDGNRGGTKNTKVMSAGKHAAKTNKTRANDKGYSGSKRYEHTRD